MCGEVAVGSAEFVEAAGKRIMVLGFFQGDADPVVVEGVRQAGEAGDDVPGEIDGSEFDVRECMNEGDAALGAGRSARHAAGRHEFRFIGMRGSVGRLGAAKLQRPAFQRGGSGSSFRHFEIGRGGGEDLHRPFTEALAHKTSSALRTSSAWPGTLTLRHTARTMPFSSMMKVERSMPI